MDDLISRQAMREAMHHEAMEKDSDEQKWDGGCWIRYKMFERVIESIPSAQQWIPCSERLPDEDHWLGGSGKRFSEEVLVTIVHHDDDDTWTDTTHTVDGEWMLELPRHCEVIAWRKLPEPYKESKR